MILRRKNPHVFICYKWGGVCGTGQGGKRRGAMEGCRRKAEASAPAYPLWHKAEGSTLGLVYEVRADVSNLARKCHKHLFHGLAISFYLTLKELVEIDKSSVPCP